MGLVLRSRREPADRCGRQRPPPAGREPAPARRRPNPDRRTRRAGPGVGGELAAAGTQVCDTGDRSTPRSSGPQRVASRPGSLAGSQGAGPGDGGGDRAARRRAVRRPSRQARRPAVAISAGADGARSPQGCAPGTRSGRIGGLRDVRRAGPGLLGAAETALPAGPLPRFSAPRGPGVGDGGSPARQLPALRSGERHRVTCTDAVQHLPARPRRRAGARGPRVGRRGNRGDEPVAPQAGRGEPPARSRAAWGCGGVRRGAPLVQRLAPGPGAPGGDVHAMAGRERGGMAPGIAEGPRTDPRRAGRPVLAAGPARGRHRRHAPGRAAGSPGGVAAQGEVRTLGGPRRRAGAGTQRRGAGGGP